MFSRQDVGNYVNEHFESAWEMVREVPIIRIDFGAGRVATRTLHGNIASYVCYGDGQIVDILPGIYTPEIYRTALALPCAFANDTRTVSADVRRQRLRDYHTNRAQALRNPPAPRPNQPVRERDLGKRVAEFRTENIVRQPNLNGPGAAPAARPRAGTDLAAWEMLLTDTQINESQRRLQIHDRLARTNRIYPEQIKKWLYKEVLHADLTDPYLGLGDALLGDDIFRGTEGF